MTDHVSIRWPFIQDMPMKTQPDFGIEDHGTLVLFRLWTPAARAWWAENVSTEAYQWLSSAVAVEHRYAEDLIHAMSDAGLTHESL